MPSELHEARVVLLDALARLAGFTQADVGILGGVGQPDVVRVHASCGSIFIGEAKDTETPERRDTAERLRNYVRFFAASRRTRGAGSILALCVGDLAPGWRDLLWRIGVGEDLDFAFTLVPVPSGVVIWARLKSARRTWVAP